MSSCSARSPSQGPVHNQTTTPLPSPPHTLPESTTIPTLSATPTPSATPVASTNPPTLSAPSGGLMQGTGHEVGGAGGQEQTVDWSICSKAQSSLYCFSPLPSPFPSPLPSPPPPLLFHPLPLYPLPLFSSPPLPLPSSALHHYWWCWWSADSACADCGADLCQRHWLATQEG